MTIKTARPQRTCVGCRKKDDQDKFLAVTRLKNGVVIVNEPYVQQGRSVYLCKNPACLKKAGIGKSKNALSYWLKVKIPDEIWAKLVSILESKRS